MCYEVWTKKSKKPLKITCDLREATIFANRGRDRRIFKDKIAVLQGGTIAYSLLDWKNAN